MTALLRAAARRLDDAMNPIVVKELRQAVTGRFVPGVLLLYLLVSLVTMSVILLFEADGSGTFGAGREALLWLQGILLGTCLLFLPLYAGARLALERSDANVDLLFISTIPARAIVWGKLLAAAILAVVIYSACTPYLMMTFLLRGVDLPSIAIVLAVGFAVVTTCIALGLFAAVVTLHRGFRAILMLLLVAALVAGFGYTMVFSFFTIQFGLGSMIDTWEFWGVAATVAGVWLGGLLLLHVWTVALVKPPSANRALPVRLVMMIVWLGAGVTAVLWAELAGEPDGVLAWVATSIPYFGVALFAAICEREEWGPRVARTIPRSPLLRIPAFFLWSGAAGGILWAAAMMAASLGADFLLAAYTSIPSFRHTMLAGSTLVAGDLLAYALTALLLRRFLLGRFLKPVHTWALGIVVAALATFLPPLAAFFIHGPGQYGKHTWWLRPSLMSLALDATAVARAQEFVALWVAAAGLLSLPWFLRQARAFRPPARGAAAAAAAPEAGGVAAARAAAGAAASGAGGTSAAGHG